MYISLQYLNRHVISSTTSKLVVLVFLQSPAKDRCAANMPNRVVKFATAVLTCFIIG